MPQYPLSPFQPYRPHQSRPLALLLKQPLVMCLSSSTDRWSTQRFASWSAWRPPPYSMRQYPQSPLQPSPLQQCQRPAQSSKQRLVWCSDPSTDLSSKQRFARRSTRPFAWYSWPPTVRWLKQRFALSSIWKRPRCSMPQYPLSPSRPSLPHQ